MGNRADSGRAEDGRDDRFRGSPAHLRAPGRALRTPRRRTGEAIGTECLPPSRPRRWSRPRPHGVRDGRPTPAEPARERVSMPGPDQVFDRATRATPLAGMRTRGATAALAAATTLAAMATTSHRVFVLI